MFSIIIKKQIEFTYVLIKIGIFSIFLILFLYLDINREGHIKNVSVLHIFLDVLMALINSFTFGLTIAQYQVLKKSTSSDQIGILGTLFGVFTFGCIPCAVSWLSIIGINVSIPFLFKYAIVFKFISLVLITFGLLITLYILKKDKCSVKPKEN